MQGSENAEMLALRALAWIAGEADMLTHFLDASGASAATLRTDASDPAFLGSVLDFLLLDDAWVVAFCDVEGLGYDAPMRARAALPGGSITHWT